MTYMCMGLADLLMRGSLWVLHALHSSHAWPYTCLPSVQGTRSPQPSQGYGCGCQGEKEGTRGRGQGGQQQEEKANCSGRDKDGKGGGMVRVYGKGGW